MPAGLTGAAPKPLDPAYEASSLGRAMALTAEPIDDYGRSNARVPSELAEIDRQPWGLTRYERISDHRYLLTASSSSGSIVLESMWPRRDFTGGSLELLQKGSTGAMP